MKAVREGEYKTREDYKLVEKLVKLQEGQEIDFRWSI